jgi:hypothetical protein
MTFHKSLNCSIVNVLFIELLNENVWLMHKLTEFVDEMLSNWRFGYQFSILTDKCLNPSHAPIVDIMETVSD